MLKRMCTLFLALAFFTTASASTIGPEAVRAAVAELNFALNVQWDQQDQAFYKAQIEKFKGKIEALQAEGMTMAQIIDATSATVNDAKLAAELKQALTVIEAGNMGMEEAQRLVINAARNSGARGASWSSDVYLWIGPVIALALVIALLSGGGDGGSSDNGGGSTNPGTGPTYQCGYNYLCSWSYDQWGHYGYNCDYVWSCGWYN